MRLARPPVPLTQAQAQAQARDRNIDEPHDIGDRLVRDLAPAAGIDRGQRRSGASARTQASADHGAPTAPRAPSRPESSYRPSRPLPAHAPGDIPLSRTRPAVRHHKPPENRVNTAAHMIKYVVRSENESHLKRPSELRELKRGYLVARVLVRAPIPIDRRTTRPGCHFSFSRPYFIVDSYTSHEHRLHTGDERPSRNFPGQRCDSYAQKSQTSVPSKM